MNDLCHLRSCSGGASTPCTARRRASFCGFRGTTTSSPGRTCWAGTVYAWYDEQAGQLRCALTSAPPDRLPFRARYYVTTNAAEVVRLAAADPRPGLVVSDQLAAVEDSSEITASLIEQPQPIRSPCGAPSCDAGLHRWRCNCRAWRDRPMDWKAAQRSLRQLL
jgi:hypothetical protein